MEWVNWQRMQSSVKPEVERLEQQRQDRFAAQDEAIRKAVGQLSDEAGKQAAEGRFKGFEGMSGYEELQKQRDEALRSEKAAMMSKSPWESALLGPTEGMTQGMEESPWASLSARLSAEASKYARQSGEATRSMAGAPRETQRPKFPMKRWSRAGEVPLSRQQDTSGLGMPGAPRNPFLPRK